MVRGGREGGESVCERESVCGVGCCEGVTVGRRCGGERGEGGGSCCHWLVLCLEVHQLTVE